MKAIKLISVGAHEMGDLGHKGDSPRKDIVFDHLDNHEVLHITAIQNFTRFLRRFEMQNPDAIGAFMRERVYCWHRRHETCEMVKHFRPKVLVICKMPQLIQARLERFVTASHIPDSVKKLVVTVNLLDYE